MRIFRTSIFGMWWLLTLVLSGGCATSRIQKPAAPDPLILQIRNVLESRELKGTHWGIHVETDQGELLLDFNGEIRTIPASTMKLLTTASALVLLGPDYRIPTEFLADGATDSNGVLHGDLIIKGYGDPSLAALSQSEAIKLADQWSDSLKHLGLTSVDGCMWGDGTALDPTGCQMSWEVEDQYYIYGANVSALSIADNSLRISILPSQEQWSPAVVRSWPSSIPIHLTNHVTTSPLAHAGSISVTPSGDDSVESWSLKGEIAPLQRPVNRTIPLRQPESLFLAVTAEGFRVGNIKLADGIGGFINPETRVSYRGIQFPSRDHTGSRNRDTLYVHWSPPLCEIIRLINTESHNLGAELLIRHLGWATTGRGTLKDGRSAASWWLASAGLDTTDISWVDGSGLARRNLLSPRWVVQLLRVMAHHPYTEEFRTSLAVMGETGTLRGRGHENGLSGRVWAKTGSMSGVSNISGYMITRNGNRVVFSIMANGTNKSIHVLQRAQDRILNILFELV